MCYINTQAEQGEVFQRHLIADGNGEASKPFKIEWATVKDGLLYIGSFGLEWVEDGQIKHRNPEWVKTIAPDGQIRNINWHPVYQAMRTVTNTTRPGYLWHEAVHWDARSRRWVFLPRKASHGVMYDPLTDEKMGTNMIITSNEDFTDWTVRRFKDNTNSDPSVLTGHSDAAFRTLTRSLYQSNEYGFTSIKKLPGSESIYLATKVREVGDEMHTVLCIFDLDGNILSQPNWIDVGPEKYEGLEFMTSSWLHAPPSSTGF